MYIGGVGMGSFDKKDTTLPSENIAYLCQCLEKGGKQLANSAIGLAKKASKNY